MRRFTFVGLLFATVISGSDVRAQVAPVLDANDESDEDSGRMLVNVFVGEVISNFASNANLDYVSPSDDDGDSDIRRLAGFTFSYRLAESENYKRQWWVFGEARHSARSLETACDASDPECAEVPPGQDPEDFFRIIEGADTLEWQGGVVWAHLINDEETAWYVKVAPGFIRAEGEQDDVVDNHFVGLGLEHETGVFAGSYLEAGWGRTDLYATKRSERAKLSAVLFYTPQGDGGKEDSLMSFFAQGLLDSDLGPGSDDVQILFGLTFDVGRVAGLVMKGRAAGQ